MKDAVGGSLLLNLVVIFTSVIILFFAGIMGYSKAYKIKNKIIEVIERYESYEESEDAIKVINNELRMAGYRNATSADMDKKCDAGNLNEYGYYYCVYKNDTLSEDSYSYKVVTYIHFDFPVIGGMLVFPVKGETRILGKSYNY